MFKSKPFYIRSDRREVINKVDPEELLLALAEKYKYEVKIDPHNRKTGFKEFYRQHKIPVHKKERIFSLLTYDALQYCIKSNTTINNLLSSSKELDKYLVYLWQEDLL